MVVEDRPLQAAPGYLEAHAGKIQIGMRRVGHILVDHCPGLFIDDVFGGMVGKGRKRSEQGGEYCSLKHAFHNLIPLKNGKGNVTRRVAVAYQDVRAGRWKAS